LKRNNLLAQLQAYNPTAQEVETQKTIINFVKKYENCFERSLTVGHITASAFLLNKEHTQALLMLHKKLNLWVQLGGHCDGDSNTLAVAIKEAQEESGIQAISALSQKIFDIDVHRIPANKHEPEHFHYDIRYLLAVQSDEKIVQNSESKELRWISKTSNELPTAEQSVMRLFNKWQAL